MTVTLARIAVGVACATLAGVCLDAALAVSASPEGSELRPVTAAYRAAAVVCAVGAAVALAVAAGW